MVETNSETITNPYAIELIDITKTFLNGKIVANQNVTIRVNKGEVHAIVGENGAGKSTLMSILFGIYDADMGSIKINGNLVKMKTSKDATNLKIGMVHQHFKLIEAFTVLENVILGQEYSKASFLKMRESIHRFKELNQKYGLGLNYKLKVKSLTVGQKQKVEIMKLLWQEKDILILDEPTATLSIEEISKLLEIIKSFRKNGKTVIFISHKIKELNQIADRITILKKGKVTTTVNANDLSINEISKLIVGKIVELKFNKKNVIDKNFEPIIEAKGISYALGKPISYDKIFKFQTDEINLQIKELEEDNKTFNDQEIEEGLKKAKLYLNEYFKQEIIKSEKNQLVKKERDIYQKITNLYLKLESIIDFCNKQIKIADINLPKELKVLQNYAKSKGIDNLILEIETTLKMLKEFKIKSNLSTFSETNQKAIDFEKDAYRLNWKMIELENIVSLQINKVIRIEKEVNKARNNYQKNKNMLEKNLLLEQETKKRLDEKFKKLEPLLEEFNQQLSQFVLIEENITKLLDDLKKRANLLKEQEIKRLKLEINNVKINFNDEKNSNSQKEIDLNQKYQDWIAKKDYQKGIISTTSKSVVKLNGISFKLYKGEILGIAGIQDNGQTELLEIITGLLKPQEGTIKYNGRVINSQSIENHNAIMSHIPENRQKYGIVENGSININAILTDYSNPRYVKWGWEKLNTKINEQIHKSITIDNYQLEKHANFIVKRYNVEGAQDLKSPIKNLSGGNQQKFVVGRELLKNKDLVIAGYPTRGLDIGAIYNIYNELIKEAERGKAILLMSLELDELIAVCDRILIFYNGKIMKEVLEPKKVPISNYGSWMIGEEVTN